MYNTLEIEFNSEEMYKNGKLDVSIRMVGFQPYRVRIITIFKDNVFGIRNMVFHNWGVFLKDLKETWHHGIVGVEKIYLTKDMFFILHLRIASIFCIIGCGSQGWGSHSSFSS